MAIVVADRVARPAGLIETFHVLSIQLSVIRLTMLAHDIEISRRKHTERHHYHHQTDMDIGQIRGQC